jgi:hypothetical protein
MAEETTPRAITYKEVRKANESDAGTTEMWRKIGEISGAGHVPLDVDGNASIDVTDLADSKIARIDKLISGAKDEEQEQTAETSTATPRRRGNQ